MLCALAACIYLGSYLGGHIGPAGMEVGFQRRVKGKFVTWGPNELLVLRNVAVPDNITDNLVSLAQSDVCTARN